MPKMRSAPLPKKKIILGIDPGLADTGFGLIVQQGHRLSVLDYGNITTKAHTKTPDRLTDIHRSVSELIDRYHPEIVAVEKLFFAKNSKTALAVGEARGVILLAIGQHHLPLVEFTPLQIKVALSGYGKAVKKQMQQMVKVVLNLKEIPEPDDAADALAAAICCSQHKTFL